MQRIIKIFSSIFFLCMNMMVFAQQRFPQPEFENGYAPPPTSVPLPRGMIMEYIDMFVFVLLLSLITYFILKKRSRKFVIWSGVFSVLYFGFYRQGCVCSIGAIQNVTLALFDSSFILPVSVVVFFFVPILFTLLFGRTFCSGVCLFGALQELVIFKPVKIPTWINKFLSIIPVLYLVLAVLFAATDSDFIICRYDPFIGFFRSTATLGMYIFGVIILLTGLFVARPYCRFLCPYGVILSWVSRISVWHLSITPSECIQCKLCENSCPVDAIEIPDTTVKPESGKTGIRRLKMILLLTPLIIISFGFLASLFYKPLSMVNPRVSLAEEIAYEQKNKVSSLTKETEAFNSSGVQTTQLFKEATEIRRNFYQGTWIAGMILGLLFSLSLIYSSRLRRAPVYRPDKADCVNCSRCYKYCPVDREKDLNADDKI